MVKVVALVTETTVAPAGMLLPTRIIPGVSPFVELTVTVVDPSPVTASSNDVVPLPMPELIVKSPCPY